MQWPTGCTGKERLSWWYTSSLLRGAKQSDRPQGLSVLMVITLRCRSIAGGTQSLGFCGPCSRDQLLPLLLLLVMLMMLVVCVQGHACLGRPHNPQLRAHGDSNREALCNGWRKVTGSH
jgi:hypothetical protein